MIESLLRSTARDRSDYIKVKAEHGWITLSGEVEWDCQRESAMDAVRNLRGVVGISDAICVKPSATTSDATSDIDAALVRRANNEAQRISLTVHGSDVTLSGTAHT